MTVEDVLTPDGPDGRSHADRFAHHPGRAGFVRPPPAARQLGGPARRLLPPGWTLQWCLHFDAIDPAPALGDPSFAPVADCLVVSHSLERTGPARARNRALAGAAGELVSSSDDDDALGPSWFRLVELLAGQPAIVRVAGMSDDMDEDGAVSTAGAPAGLTIGGCPAGTAAEPWLHGGAWPFSCCALMARTALVRAVGGWSALG